MKKPTKAKAATPAAKKAKAAQPGNRPGRGKAAHAKPAARKPVPAAVRAQRHAAAVRAAKTRAKNAAKAKHHPRRQLALGDGVACCSAEALAASLRLSGRAVSDEDVLALYWHTARDEHAGASILATLEAAAEYGLAGLRPVSFAPVPEMSWLEGPENIITAIRPALILGLALPAPHAVAATLEGWWSWGGLFSAADFPDAVIEEAWAVQWRPAT